MLAEAPARILVVEDDTALRKLIQEEFDDAGYEVRSAAEAESALKTQTQWPADLIVSDLRLPGSDGLWLLNRAREFAVPPAFIVITAFGTVPQAVEALKFGADNFLTKPLDLDHLLLSAQRALETRRLRENVKLFHSVLGKNDFHGIIGRSTAMNTLFITLQRVARATGPVLITGESGTGKDLVARAVHKESPSQKGPFVAVNCAAIPSELQESEFFGHSAGAFTGAEKARKGLFAEAEGGLLFLDEIGEMPLQLQAKLLRILQDGLVRPVGTNTEKRINVRIIAATNCNLEEKVSSGHFREDLFYRLETFNLHVPPLRERDDDLDFLCAWFIHLFNSRMQRNIRGISNTTQDILHSYPFPGNVRELRNAMERAVAFSTGPDIQPEDLPVRIREHARPLRYREANTLPALMSEEEGLVSLDEMANRYTRFVLNRVHDNKRKAAQVLGISRATLYRRLDIAKGDEPN